MTLRPPLPSLEDYNGWADFWRYDIGVNVIPADSKNKRPSVPWGQYQDKSISEELHNQWKSENAFSKGMAVIAGRCWFGKYAGLFLNKIDADNIKAIEEICSREGKTISVEHLAKWTLVEQHPDDRTRLHVYILSNKPFPKKSSDINRGNNEEPAIEIKGLG